MGRRRLGRLLRAVHPARLHGRDHHQAAADHGGRRDPLSGCRAHRQDRRHHRRALRAAAWWSASAPAGCARSSRRLGSPPFEERGRVTDEYLQAFKALWTEDAPRFEGRHVRFADVSFLPKPVQKPHPPIWVGGESPAALRRTARHGDVWFPIGNNPRHPLDTVARFGEGVQQLHQIAEQNGRDPKSIGLAFYAGWFDEAKTARLAERRAPHPDRHARADRRRHRRARGPRRHRPGAELSARHARAVARQHAAFLRRDPAADRVRSV